MATFKEAIEYAQKNPTSDFAKQLETGIKSGQYTQVAQQEGFDLSSYANPEQAQKIKEEPVVTGYKKIEQAGSKLAEETGLLNETGKFVQTLGQAINAPDAAKKYGEALKMWTDAENKLASLIIKKQQAGEDVSHLKEVYAQNKQPKLEDFTGEVINKSPYELGKEAGGAIADIVGLGTGSAVAKGASPVIEAGGKQAEKLVKVGRDVAKTIETKIAKRATEKSVSKTLDMLKGTEETLSKAERIQAGKEGRLVATELGGKDFLPSETEKRAAEILSGKLKSNPVKNIPIVKKEIATRGKEAEQYLIKNPKKITNKEHFDMFAAARAEMEKYSTEAELKAYDETVSLFEKQLPKKGSYDTPKYYIALKEFEENVASKLPKGKAALLDPTGIASAKVNGASNVRKIVRDMIGKKNSEFKPKMFDLVSLYDVADTIAIKADKLQGNIVTRFVKKHPYITGAAATAVGGPIVKDILGI